MFLARMSMLCSSQPAIIFCCSFQLLDTLIGLTDCVGQGPNVVCGDIESLADIGCSLTGGRIRGMASDSSALTMLCHSEINLEPSLFWLDFGSLWFAFIFVYIVVFLLMH